MTKGVIGLFWPTLLAICCSVLAACALGFESGTPLYERLAGRGPVLVAQENPYLPANRFLEEQIRDSEVFKNHISEMGRPLALRVDSEVFSPTQVVLYYPETDQQVVFYKSGSEWVREDPTSIDADDKQKIVAEYQLADASAQVNAGTPTKPDEKPSDVRARLSPKLFGVKEAALRQLRTGDYEHRVTFPGETMSLLADWYTGRRDNADALAKASKRHSSQKLHRGDRIVIPKRLLRNPKPLPDAALR